MRIAEEEQKKLIVKVSVGCLVEFNFILLSDTLVIGEYVKPRTRFYLIILGALALSIFFVGLGAYAIIVSMGLKDSSRLLVAGLGCIFLGLILFFKETLQWIKPIKKAQNNTLAVCPFCGALIKKETTFCDKCKRQLKNDCCYEGKK